MKVSSCLCCKSWKKHNATVNQKEVTVKDGKTTIKSIKLDQIVCVNRRHNHFDDKFTVSIFYKDKHIKNKIVELKLKAKRRVEAELFIDVFRKMTFSLYSFAIGDNERSISTLVVQPLNRVPEQVYIALRKFEKHHRNSLLREFFDVYFQSNGSKMSLNQSVENAENQIPEPLKYNESENQGLKYCKKNKIAENDDLNPKDEDIRN